MTIDEMKSRVTELNSKIAEVNNIRNQSIGKREALAEKFSTLTEQYEQAYGVDVRQREAMDAEIAKILAEKEQEVNKVSEALDLIERGKYGDAERLLTGTTEVDEEVKRMAAEQAERERQAKEEASAERAEVRSDVKAIKSGEQAVGVVNVDIPIPHNAVPVTTQPTTTVAEPTPVVEEQPQAEPAVTEPPVASPAPTGGKSQMLDQSISDALREVFNTDPVKPSTASQVIPSVPNATQTGVGAAPNAPTPAPIPNTPPVGAVQGVADFVSENRNAEAPAVQSAVEMFSNPVPTAPSVPSTPTPAVPNTPTSVGAGNPVSQNVDDFMSQMGLGSPAPSVPTPSVPANGEKPKSFDAVFGGSAFGAPKQ